MRNLHNVNGALMALLPKSSQAVAIKDYRLIAVIHLIGKMILKVLSNRLATQLDKLVHKSQSAFIKGRLVHDNFRFMQFSAKLLHAHRIPCLLFKVDLAHAFDSVAWQFLIEMMHHMGFSRGRMDWIAALLSSARTRVLLNGSPGGSICHAHRLRRCSSC
jgi:hypothetical protein